MVSEQNKKNHVAYTAAYTEHETMTVLSSHVCNPFVCAYVCIDVLGIKCCWPEHLTESHCTDRRT